MTDFPEFSEIELEDRPLLHPLFQQLEEGISEFTFANLFLFRREHRYKISRIDAATFVISGNDTGIPYFMLPFGLPEDAVLKKLFTGFAFLKNASQNQAEALRKKGYFVMSDRDNFDYLYSRDHLARLPGRKFSKKRNLLKNFLASHNCEARPLLEEYTDDAKAVLEQWCRLKGGSQDCRPAREALEKMEELQLCGGIYYIDGQPVGYTLGEELAGGTMYAIHFEKALPDYKGLYQYINQSFAALLPESYILINREQDLGNEGLRQAKMSYRPVGFVKKFRVQTEPFEAEQESHESFP